MQYYAYHIREDHIPLEIHACGLELHLAGWCPAFLFCVDSKQDFGIHPTPFE